MKVWSSLALLLGATSAAEPTESADITVPADVTDPYYYNYHYCNFSSNCAGTLRCGHYSYWSYGNHYDFKTCVAPATCGKYIKRGTSSAYVFCS
eukprot:CAMPEP_0170493552 /NCGR_PEP_ID=MMETSP0208-20121228/14080_1 /TAXON_ID=197538 /ORGANISM="Strombidium inclinatum, Strain S3" /LENGTH=93 /DNA_ID=CAMNT_0010769497 /DNA_START=24 /DNA_END=305 /DNA_ORIENTATION=+